MCSTLPLFFLVWAQQIYGVMQVGNELDWMSVTWMWSILPALITWTQHAAGDVSECTLWRQWVGTVAILAQGTHWALLAKQAFLQHWPRFDSSRVHVCVSLFSVSFSRRVRVGLNHDLLCSVWRVGPQLRARVFSVMCRTSIASSWVQYGVPDPNCKLVSSVWVAGPQLGVVRRAGPQPRSCEFSVTTATLRLEWQVVKCQVAKDFSWWSGKWQHSKSSCRKYLWNSTSYRCSQCWGKKFYDVCFIR